MTPMTAEHRLFYWLSYPMLSDNNLYQSLMTVTLGLS